MKLIKYTLLSLLFFIVSVFTAHSIAQETNASNESIWHYWNESDEDNEETIDHGRWQTILDKYLIANHPSGINRFAYRRVSEADKALLQTYIDTMQDTDPLEYNKQEQKAYWINFYNALTVNVILIKQPYLSILTTGNSLIPKGPWDDSIANVAEEALSLNDIEHRILRPIWQDYRIHFAVNCASLGCPNLQAKAFTADNIDTLLDSATKEFLNHPRGLFLDKNTLRLSSIFKWYQADFANTEAQMLVVLSQYLSNNDAAMLKSFNGTIDYKYDWFLNKP